MELNVYSRSGSDTGRTVTLDERVFGGEPNDHAIWLDVRAAQAHARQGTHKTKERAEVAYSTRKLYRQKGTGHARAGSAKSPIRKGGGTIFGPRPHTYSVNVNKKTKRVARRSALVYKLREDALRIVEDFQLDAPKTREVVDLIKGHGLDGRKVLVLTGERDDVLYRSGRNIPGVAVMEAAQASTLDLMQAQTVLLQEGALDVLTRVLSATGKPEVAAEAENGAAAAPDAAEENA